MLANLARQESYHAISLLWDQHTCLALSPSAVVADLLIYERPGGGVLSVNVGYSPHSFDDVESFLDHFTAQIMEHPRIELARGVDDIDRVAAQNRLAVVFDLEDAGPLEGDISRVLHLYERGLRTLAPTYNYTNLAGGGCLDADDPGLRPWGRELVREMNATGIVPDGSHCGARTGLDLCAVSSGPVIYSHSSMRSIWDHPRNITDDQARGCADTGGVVGITGVGIFLGANTPTLDAMIAHIEYAVELVGVDHVGVSSDYSFDHVDFLAEIERNPERFDASYTKWGPIEWLPPDRLLRLPDLLFARGWHPDDIAAVIGGNFRRVAEESWR